MHVSALWEGLCSHMYIMSMYWYMCACDLLVWCVHMYVGVCMHMCVFMYACKSSYQLHELELSVK